MLLVLNLYAAYSVCAEGENVSTHSMLQVPFDDLPEPLQQAVKSFCLTIGLPVLFEQWLKNATSLQIAGGLKCEQLIAAIKGFDAEAFTNNVSYGPQVRHYYNEEYRGVDINQNTLYHNGMFFNEQHPMLDIPAKKSKHLYHFAARYIHSSMEAELDAHDALKKKLFLQRPHKKAIE